jgi:DNA-binding IclR family transcriptional regulator
MRLDEVEERDRRSGSANRSRDPGTLERASSRAPAVSRAASVLRCLAGEQLGLGVSEIARRVGLVPSTCLHVLRALVDEGFVAFDAEEKTYRTGVGLLTLVRESMANSQYPRIVQPVLDTLAAENHVNALAVELDSRERMVVVAFARAASTVSLYVSVGSRFPAYVGATGRCVAAASGLSKDKLKKRFETLEWEREPRFEEWYADVERAQVEGVALDRGNYIRGLTVLAALIPPHRGKVTRGIALIGFDHQMTERTIRTLKEQVRESVRIVGAQMN